VPLNDRENDQSLVEPISSMPRYKPPN
jgi:hypothetical protein